MENFRFLLLCIVFSVSAFAQKGTGALAVQKVVLDNGLTVYLNEDKNENRVFGAVVVKAGSKNDPPDATGLAHYLEHLLFKGTRELGTVDYEKEKPFLDSINIYYDILGKTTDEFQRKNIQLLINNQSVKAAQYGFPNEFDKLLKSIGSTGINAFTEQDKTVFYNYFPGSQIDKWLDLYSVRFIDPVFRSFQSELEIVYEEKNSYADDFQTILQEETAKWVYKNHAYSQPIVGKTEHLKNPPISRIYEFFKTYYVANNMALILCGNFDSEKVLPVIKEKFGRLKSGKLPLVTPITPYRFVQNEKVSMRVTPLKVSLLAWKSIPAGHKDMPALDVCTYLLNNESETGLLDKLMRDGKVLYAFTGPEYLNEDGSIHCIIIPKMVGQSFDKAEALFFEQINKLKKGDFSDELLNQIKEQAYIYIQKDIENIEARALSIADYFEIGQPWENYLKYPNEIKKVTKEDIMRVINKYFGENYFSLHSKMGFPKKEKLEKPGYKPVVTDQIGKSTYAKYFETLPVNLIEPKFLDFTKDAVNLPLGTGNQLYATANPYNDIFSLTIKYHAGSYTIKNLDLAAEFLNNCSVSGKTLDEFKNEMSSFGITYSIYSSYDELIISLEGTERHFSDALKLIQNLVSDPIPSPYALKNVVENVRAERKAEDSQASQMGSMALTYVLYGKESMNIDRISSKDLQNLKESDLISLLKKAFDYSLSVHYAGNKNPEEIQKTITNNYPMPVNGSSVPPRSLTPVPVIENTVYIVDDKNVRQTQVYFSIISDPYSRKDDGVIDLFNEYYGGDFSGIIVQEVREYRSLAYSAWGRYASPLYEGKPCSFYTYVGCQDDKTNEAVKVVHQLIDSLPLKPDLFTSVQLQTKNTIANYYPNFRSRSSTIEYFKMIGLNDDPRKLEYAEFDKLTFDDILMFYKKKIHGRPFAITIYGDKSKIDMTMLSRYGKIVELSKNDIRTE